MAFSWKFTKFEAGLVLFLPVLMATCTMSVATLNFEKDKQVAEDTVTRFHALYNESNFDGMYDLFTERGRDRTTRQEFFEQAKLFRQKAGFLKSTRAVRTDVEVIGGTRVVNVFYQTEFENLSKLEEFDCVVASESALIDFYGHPESLPAAKK